MSARLQWAMVNGEPLSVFALIDAKPDDRPKGACPGCGRGTVWKIGEGKVTPHVAHEADAACSESGVTASETAEHLNAKLHLKTLLAATRSISISTRCREGHEHRRAWDVPAWDSVEAEYAIGSVRPDIVLTSSTTGEQVAVEVLHSHAVDGRKTRKLAALGIPWIEVRAEFALAWTGQGALRVHAADAATHPPGCRRCADIAARAEEERAARAARMAAQAAKAQQEREAECARALVEAEKARLAAIRQELREQREQRERAEAAARKAELLAAQREQRERAEAAAREAMPVVGHDYKASREHWNAVFAEPWAQEYLRSVRDAR